MPAFANSASLRRCTQDCGTRSQATSSLGRSVSAQRLACLLVVAWLALLPSLAWSQERERLSIDAGTPVTVYADRVQNLEQEKLLLADGNVQIEQGDVRLEADRVEVNTETGEAVATGRVVLFDGRDRLTGRAHRVQPPLGHRHRVPGAGRRRAALLLRRRPHGALRRQGVPHRERRLHDVRGRDPGVVGPPRHGDRLPRRLHVGHRRVVLGVASAARPVHPVLRDEPPQGPAQRAPGADLRQQQRQGVLRPAADLLRAVRQPGPDGGARLLPEARVRDRRDLPLRPHRGLPGRDRRVLPPRQGRVAGLRRGPRGGEPPARGDHHAAHEPQGRRRLRERRQVPQPSSATRSTSAARSASSRTSRSPSAGRSGTSSAGSSPTRTSRPTSRSSSSGSPSSG